MTARTREMIRRTVDAMVRAELERELGHRWHQRIQKAERKIDVVRRLRAYEKAA